MTAILFSLLLLQATEAAPDTAAAPPAQVLKIDGQKSKVSFSVDSTLHLVEGNAPTLSGDVSLDGAAKQVTATLTIGTSSIETGNESRDKKMKAEVLDVTTHKTIAYKVESIAGDADKLFAKSPATLSLKGKLTLLSKEHPLDATATAKYEGDALVVDGKAQIDMDVWQVPDMSGMLLKVKRKIDVEFHIVAAP